MGTISGGRMRGDALEQGGSGALWRGSELRPGWVLAA
jgi:hypothetical protein